MRRPLVWETPGKAARSASGRKRPKRRSIPMKQGEPDSDLDLRQNSIFPIVAVALHYTIPCGASSCSKVTSDIRRDPTRVPETEKG
jgi:hypothetical protein